MKYIPAKELKLLNETGRISTHPHIHCSKCGSKTTAFGSNLKSKMEKAGGLGTLLVTFECRACRPKKEKRESAKAPRKNKGLAKQSKAAELIRNLPKMQFPERRRISLIEEPDFAAEVTASSCVRPDIFLDSNRSCDFCALYNVCAAPCRNLSKHGWQAA